MSVPRSGEAQPGGRGRDVCLKSKCNLAFGILIMLVKGNCLVKTLEIPFSVLCLAPEYMAFVTLGKSPLFLYLQIQIAR